MGMLPRPQPTVVENCLQGERRSELRRGYLADELYAMAGASDGHTLICSSLATALRRHVHGTAGRPYIADVMMMRLPAAGAAVLRYPEPMRACYPGGRARDDRARPGPIAERRAGAAARIDRRVKRLACGGIASLQWDAPLAQGREAESHRREDRGRWRCVSAGEHFFRCADAAGPLATTSVPPL